MNGAFLFASFSALVFCSPLRHSVFFTPIVLNVLNLARCAPRQRTEFNGCDQQTHHDYTARITMGSDPRILWYHGNGNYFLQHNRMHNLRPVLDPFHIQPLYGTWVPLTFYNKPLTPTAIVPPRPRGAGVQSLTLVWSTYHCQSEPNHSTRRPRAKKVLQRYHLPTFSARKLAFPVVCPIVEQTWASPKSATLAPPSPSRMFWLLISRWSTPDWWRNAKPFRPVEIRRSAIFHSTTRQTER